MYACNLRCPCPTAEAARAWVALSVGIDCEVHMIGLSGEHRPNPERCTREAAHVIARFRVESERRDSQ